MDQNLARYNGWLPPRDVHNAFVARTMRSADGRFEAHEAHVQAVEDFKQVLNNNPTMAERINGIFEQAPHLRGQLPQLQTQVRDFEHLLYLLDVIVTAPPQYSLTEGNPPVNGPIGVPMYLVFDLLNNTSAGHELFCMKEFNEALRDLLRSWSAYLITGDSRKTLHADPGGWFSPEGLNALNNGRGPFDTTYAIVDPGATDRGFTSWDDFFTRQFKPDQRIVQQKPPNTVIYNACESTVERIVSNVQAHDTFWLKDSMPYSLYHIFNRKRHLAERFVGGQVYQAFLGPVDYHRWHSPVTGTVVHAEVIPGTYYAALPDNGDHDDPRGALIRSQPWLTAAATRAVIIIQAPRLGPVAFIGVGMAEVSSCQLMVQPGHKVVPGQQIGMFHFGGSSHAVIFDSHANIKFRNNVVDAQGNARGGQHIHVNTIIADV